MLINCSVQLKARVNTVKWHHVSSDKHGSGQNKYLNAMTDRWLSNQMRVISAWPFWKKQLPLHDPLTLDLWPDSCSVFLAHRGDSLQVQDQEVIECVASDHQLMPLPNKQRATGIWPMGFVPAPCHCEKERWWYWMTTRRKQHIPSPSKQASH